MIIVERILGKLSDMEFDQLKTEWVILDHEAMSRPHQKLTTEEGTSLAVSLPHGQHMHPMDVLYKDEDKIIVVDLAEEDALEIRPSGNRQWAKAAFNIGNMHHPAYIHDDCIVVPYSAAIEKIIEGIGVGYKRCDRKLDGERASHSTGHHSHSHDHHG